MVYTQPELAGIEIELPGMGPGTASTHSLVGERRLPHGVVHAAVYPALPEGHYRLLIPGGQARQDVVVRGAHMTEVDAREPR